jgi:hypothetical protein
MGLAFLIGFAVLLSAALLLIERRAARRNARGLCARCAVALPLEGCHRIEGSTYCSRCSAVLRVRVTGAYLALAGLIALGGVFGLVGAVRLWRQGDPTWWMMPLFMGGALTLVFFSARTVIRAMRDQNRFAEEVERARLQAAALLDGNDD